MFRIRNFVYNGFMGQLREGYSKYEGVSFLRWTNDPGIAEIMCSDGEKRFIPSWAIPDWQKHLPPMPDYKKMKEEGTFQYFGPPLHS